MNKTVLITGADGFIGSHLTELLLAKGYKVRALSMYNSFNNWGWLEELPKSANLEIVTGDIRDPFFCSTIVKGVDVIYHLAALIAIPYSYIAPTSYVETNVCGTLNMCQAAKDNGNIRLLHTSTSEVYGTAMHVPINETHPRQPQSPYSASKIGADAMALSFYNAFNLPVTIVRPFNTYGPRQSARAIIPTIITQIHQGVSEINLGDLSPTRDFNYVADTVAAFYAIAEKDSLIGEEVNVCSGTEISMQDTMELIKKIMKSDVKFITDKQRLRPDKSEVFRLVGDSAKLLKHTGFKSSYTIESGLRKTCEWFTRAENNSKYKAGIYNV